MNESDRITYENLRTAVQRRDENKRALLNLVGYVGLPLLFVGGMIAAVLSRVGG